MKNIFLILIALLFSTNTMAVKNTQYSLEKIISSLNQPWAFVFLAPKQILINQKNGKIILYDLETKEQKNILHNLDIHVKGQGGLLDLKKSPFFKKDSYLYLTYVEKDTSSLVLAKAKYRKNQALVFKNIFKSNTKSSTDRHFGSRITFDENNHIFISLGDRGERKNAQDLSTHAGSIIRLNLDGSIPPDNPFVNNKFALDEIYSYGHRNPQGLFYDKKRKLLFSNEHGPRGGDEINIIYKGKNYGWPIVSYGKEYSSLSFVGEARRKKGMEDPIKVYIPSIAPSSLLIYQGDIYKNAQGNLFSSALALKHINRIVLNKSLKVIQEERLFIDFKERIRALVEDEKGFIYFSSDQGNIYKIKKK